MFLGGCRKVYSSKKKLSTTCEVLSSNVGVDWIVDVTHIGFEVDPSAICN